MVYCYNRDIGFADLEELFDLFCIQLQFGQRKSEGGSLVTSLFHITQRQGTVWEGARSRWDIKSTKIGGSKTQRMNKKAPASG